MSRVSVTKAGGLSDALGAERSLNGKDGDTVTYVCAILLKVDDAVFIRQLALGNFFGTF